VLGKIGSELKKNISKSLKRSKTISYEEERQKLSAKQQNWSRMTLLRMSPDNKFFLFADNKTQSWRVYTIG